ncbi:cyclase family protein [Halorarius halobius]|uniref:cyclase family protein n=1 Tax=Halorarius halobius TaxID=2962671 RepID=UPI0020CCEB50|nr:cyclase family protein [Halorarius halobius]
MPEWVDLSQPFDAAAEHGATPPPEFEQVATVAEDGASVQWVGTSTHTGTHVDAPAHFLADGATIDDLSLDRFAGPGVVLGVERDAPGEIDAAALEEAETDAGATVESGDVVVLRTGWGDRYGDDDYGRYPWLTGDAADWLLEREVTLLGVDTRSPDRPRTMRPDDWDAYPVHRRLLSAGTLIAENLRVPEWLVGERVTVRGFPVNLRRGDGAPARFVARR